MHICGAIFSSTLVLGLLISDKSEIRRQDEKDEVGSITNFLGE